MASSPAKKMVFVPIANSASATTTHTTEEAKKKNDAFLSRKMAGPRKNFTMKRQDVQQESTKIMGVEAAQWIGNTLDIKEFKEIKNYSDMFPLLTNGVVLCQLANKLEGGAIDKFKADAKEGSFQARDNINKFIDACKRVFAVKDACLFEVDDLATRKNERKVINTLMELGRFGAKHGVCPPGMIAMEIEIQELMKEDAKEAKEAAEEKAKAAAAAPAPAAAAAPAPAPAEVKVEAPKVEEKKEEKKVEAPAPAPAPAAEPAPVAAPAPAAAPEVKAAEVKVEEKKEEKKEEKITEEKKVAAKKIGKFMKKVGTKRTFKTYVPLEGDSIDQTVAAVVNRAQIPVRIKKIIAKKKKDQRAEKRHHTGSYEIEKEKCYVRIIQNVLVVYTDNGWINFLRFLEEKLGYVEN